nr:T9SS C-terminal target domain-containing protein [uncultured Flavobacterium sp.]
MNIATIYFALFISTIGFSQESINSAPTIQWQKTFGGSNSGIANCIQQTTDGGFIVAGSTNSNDGEVTNHHGGTDIWIVKLNDSGSIQWQKTLGGSKDDQANSMQQTSDGGYIIAGITSSKDGDVTNKKEENGIDYWVIKLDFSGNIQWQKVFGGDSYDEAKSVQQTIDGGYILAGSSRSNFGNDKKEGLLGGFNDESWILKLNKDGIIQWQKVFGGEGYDNPESIQQTKDKGFIMVGKTNNSIITSASDFNFYVVKFDESGTIQWQKSLGGTNDDCAYSVQQTKDGDYIIAGTTQSVDGDVTNIPGGSQDFWVVKLNLTGDIVWQKAFGETANDAAYSVQQTKDGGYIMVGSSGLKDIDAIVIKLNDKGNIEWQKPMGGSEYDEVKSIQQTKDNGYILAGISNSTDGDLENISSGNRGFWIVKLKATAEIKNSK